MSTELLKQAGIKELFLDDIYEGLKNLEDMKVQLGDSMSSEELKKINEAKSELLNILDKRPLILLGEKLP